MICQHTGDTKENMGQTTIRFMHEGDIRKVLKIEKSSFISPWSEPMFRKELVSPISRSLVAVCSSRGREKVLGYVNYWVVAQECHLNNIAVDPELYRSGIGSKLMEAMINECRVEGVLWSTLEVRKSNVKAQKLYEKFGFEIKGVRRGYYSDSSEDALIMWSYIKGESEGPDEI